MSGSRRPTKVKATLESVSNTVGSVVVAGAMRGLVGLLGIAVDVADNQEEFNHLCDQLSSAAELISRTASPPTGNGIPPSLLASVENFSEKLQKVAEQKDQLNIPSKLAHLAHREENAARLRRLSLKLSQLLTEFSVELGISAQAVLNAVDANVRDLKEAVQSELEERELLVKTQELDLISTLPTVPPALYNSKYNTAIPCLQGTREGVLEHITRWINDLSPSARSVFWLCGAAGTGKSTIAQSIAERTYASGNLAATFFFSRSEVERSDVLFLFPTLASQLARFEHINPTYRHELVRLLSRAPDAAQQSLRLQIRSLFFEPLAKLELTRPVVIVVDALDECRFTDHVEELLLLLSRGVPELPRAVKIFIASRPAYQISAKLNRMVTDLLSSRLILHDIDQTLVRDDILLYLRHSLSDIDWEGRSETTWPSEAELQRLADRANQLFIFAATAVTFIRTGQSPKERLELLLADVPGLRHGQSARLDALFTQVLSESLRGFRDGEEDRQLRRILGTIVLLRDTLPLTSLAELLGMDYGVVSMIVGRLQSVLLIPESSDAPVRIIHPSFPEFLTDRERCLDKRFYILAPHHHHHIALCALAFMLDGLEHDVCTIPDRSKPNSEAEELEMRVGNSVSRTLQYACLFWTSHLVQFDPQGVQSSYPGLLRRFCETKLVHWLEVLSLLGSLATAVQSLKQLQVWLLVFKFSDELTKSLLKDCELLLLQYFVPISACPAHVYDTALAFAPDCSLRSAFWTSVLQRSVRVILGRTWGEILHIFNGHKHNIVSARFSPDGFRIVSGDEIGSIRLWDHRSGELLDVLEYQGEMAQRASSSNSATHIGTIPVRISNLSFSPDGKFLASCFSNRFIVVWNLGTHDVQLNIRLDMDWSEPCLSFSPHGSLLAIGHFYGIPAPRGIRIVDLQQRQVTRFFKDAWDVKILTFAPNRHRGYDRLAYASLTGSTSTIRVRLLDHQLTTTTLSVWEETSVVALKYAGHGSRLIVAGDFNHSFAYRLLDESSGDVISVIRSPSESGLVEIITLSDSMNFVVGEAVYRSSDGGRAGNWNLPGELCAMSHDGQSCLMSQGAQLYLARTPPVEDRSFRPRKWLGRLAGIISGATPDSGTTDFEQYLNQKSREIVSLSFSLDGTLCALVRVSHHAIVLEVWDRRGLLRLKSSEEFSSATVTFGPDNTNVFMLWHEGSSMVTELECWNVISNECIINKCRPGLSGRNVVFPRGWTQGSAVFLVGERTVSVWNPWVPSLARLQLSPPLSSWPALPLLSSGDMTHLAVVTSDGVQNYRLEGSKYQLSHWEEGAVKAAEELRKEATAYIQSGWLLCRRPDGEWARLCWIPIEKRPMELFARMDEQYQHLWWRAGDDWVVLDLSETWAARR